MDKWILCAILPILCSCGFSAWMGDLVGLDYKYVNVDEWICILFFHMIYCYCMGMLGRIAWVGQGCVGSPFDPWDRLVLSAVGSRVGTWTEAFILRCFSFHLLLYCFSRKKRSSSPWISNFISALFALISFNIIDEHRCLKTNKYRTETHRKRGKVWQPYDHIIGLW